MTRVAVNITTRLETVNALTSTKGRVFCVVSICWGVFFTITMYLGNKIYIFMVFWFDNSYFYLVFNPLDERLYLTLQTYRIKL